ncbi:hypothetical protein MYCTH_2301673 [Thermothelomyces thermophilus ATCC 42464]|uniref:Uncharacterized protein n=1 Tax=Thermothelomyces thermophilus (strain ATCC 42464 / BCRC 31852 / DSM 1799) TaxID=573729 RepID=G2Q9X1_THET4|nr:uncharacterized protein MYCTH_2301673 [Thermothelomyces thermophilus ATCC 42464]AEO56580.1 hypothetical protein MYCTH_2301673 [Thermothelomyces thermophilus ATCC 42464]
MYTQGAVPDSPPESPNPSPPPSGADCQFREPRGLRSPPGQPRMARNSNTNTNTNSNGGGGGDSSNTPAPRSSPGESGGAQSHDPPTRARSDSPVTAPVHPAPSSDGTPPPPPSPRPSSPPRQRGSAASSVVVAVPEQQQQQQAAAVGAGRVLRYRDGLVDGSISGYVKSARGSSSPRHWHDVAAVVAGGLDANVISLRRARELKLEVEPPRAGEEGAAAASFDFGTGAPPERSIGTAVFVFKTLSHFNPRHPVITVTCDVCENSPVGLILGKPFVEERERRWSKHPSEG